MLTSSLFGFSSNKSLSSVTSPARTGSVVFDGREVLNLCANNSLGLADDPAVLAAAREALARWGFGVASVRFICGTQRLHKELEARITRFLGTEDTILYPSCFDANTGLFETLLGPEDATAPATHLPNRLRASTRSARRGAHPSHGVVGRPAREAGHPTARADRNPQPTIHHHTPSPATGEILYPKPRPASPVI